MNILYAASNACHIAKDCPYATVELYLLERANCTNEPSESEMQVCD